MKTPRFKPMLAAPIDAKKGQLIDQLRYPLLATPKIDGIRCLILDGQVLSRSLKPIPNEFVQYALKSCGHNNLDGELLVGDSFQACTSGIMSEDGEPDFTYYVFDVIGAEPYELRVKALKALSKIGPRIKALLPVLIKSKEDLTAYTEKCLAQGYEGVIVRDPAGPYKCGRSTFGEGYMVKVKPFEDAEATVVGFEELLHNENVAKKNALGNTERSSHKANLKAGGTLGALICENTKLWPGVTFNIGTGYDAALRAELWASRDSLKGRLVKFKYQAYGTDERPRCPVFLGFRDKLDL